MLTESHLAVLREISKREPHDNGEYGYTAESNRSGFSALGGRVRDDRNRGELCVHYCARLGRIEGGVIMPTRAQQKRDKILQGMRKTNKHQAIPDLRPAPKGGVMAKESRKGPKVDAADDAKVFRVEPVLDSQLESRLNELAGIGWEPVSVWRDSGAKATLQLVLRRKSPPDAKSAPPKGE